MASIHWPRWQDEQAGDDEAEEYAIHAHRQLLSDVTKDESDDAVHDEDHLKGHGF